MAYFAVIRSETEAEIHYRPGLLARLFGARRSFSPIYSIKSESGQSRSWYHKYTGRRIDEQFLLRLLESIAVMGDNVQIAMIDDAVKEVNKMLGEGS